MQTVKKTKPFEHSAMEYPWLKKSLKGLSFVDWHTL